MSHNTNNYHCYHYHSIVVICNIMCIIIIISIIIIIGVSLGISTRTSIIIISIMSHVFFVICPYLWVFITGGCSGRGVQWIGVVLYSKLV